MKIKVPIGGVCNNEWLSVLENDAKTVMEPMIFGPERGGAAMPDTYICGSASPLATWAVKTALMLDLGTNAAGPIPRFFYEQFRLYRRAAPEGTVVFSGANRGDARAVRVVHGGLKLV